MLYMLFFCFVVSANIHILFETARPGAKKITAGNGR